MFARLGQPYMFNPNRAAPGANKAPAAYGATYVRGVGELLRTLEIAVTVCWNDDNSTRTTNASSATHYPDHGVTLVTGMLDPVAAAL